MMISWLEVIFNPESKKAKGIGVGQPEGLISLDDVRSLQRSNMVLFHYGKYIACNGLLQS